MFEWKVEDMALMNERGFLRMGKEKIYTCESKLTREEKIAFVDSMQDGKLSYILNLVEKFKFERDKLAKDKWDNIKTVSLNAWLRRNDERKVADTTCNYGRICFLGIKRLIDNMEMQNRYDTYKDYVDECFHRQLKECETAEKKYFLEHDEYSILKSKLRDVKHRTNFGVHMSYCSDGNIYIYDDEGKKSREITIDELKLLLSKYEQLDQYVEKLSSEIDIKF